MRNCKGRSTVRKIDVAGEFLCICWHIFKIRHDSFAPPEYLSRGGFLAPPLKFSGGHLPGRSSVVFLLRRHRTFLGSRKSHHLMRDEGQNDTNNHRGKKIHPLVPFPCNPQNYRLSSAMPANLVHHVSASPCVSHIPACTPLNVVSLPASGETLQGDGSVRGERCRVRKKR